MVAVMVSICYFGIGGAAAHFSISVVVVRTLE